MTSMTISRGNRWAKSRKISCAACVSSPMMMSRIVVSLSPIPEFEQVGFQAFKLQAQVLDVVVHFRRRRRAILNEEGEHSAAVQRYQSLKDVVTAHDGFVIRSGEFIDSFYPEFRVKAKLVFGQGSNLLQFREG